MVVRWACDLKSGDCGSTSPIKPNKPRLASIITFKPDWLSEKIHIYIRLERLIKGTWSTVGHAEKGIPAMLFSNPEQPIKWQEYGGAIQQGAIYRLLIDNLSAGTVTVKITLY